MNTEGLQTASVEVLGQVGLDCEALATSGALVFLGAGVCLHVSPQVGPVGKLLAAVGASVGLLSCVRPHMTLEEPGPRESLAAHVTLVAEVVGEDVHGQGRHADIHLVADVAGLGILRAESLVGLLVAGEVGAGGVRFSALCTLVLLALWVGKSGLATAATKKLGHCKRLDAGLWD